MDYERMWKKLKRNLVRESGNTGMRPGAYEHCKDMLLSMSKIESDEYEKERRSRKQESAVRQRQKYKEVFVFNAPHPDTTKSAKTSFEYFTGNTVIDSLEKLEREIQKRKGAPPFSDQKPIVVDENVVVPDYINHEATIRGIKILRFGTNVIVNPYLPKGVFIYK